MALSELEAREVVQEQNEGVMIERARPEEGKNAAHEALGIRCMALSELEAREEVQEQNEGVMIERARPEETKNVAPTAYLRI